MRYSIFSNECVTWVLHKLYYPEMNEMFIKYTNPFISSWFPEDDQFLRLCENHKYYTSIEPRFGDPICYNWEQISKIKRNTNAIYSNNGNYPVMFLNDIEIHWTHDKSDSLVTQKYKGRLDYSSNYEPIFLWSDAQLFNIHTNESRNNLLRRFNKINYKTIFLTKYPEEEYRDDITIVKFIPEWAGRQQNDRNESHLLTWYDNFHLAPIFKSLMENF